MRDRRGALQLGLSSMPLALRILDGKEEKIVSSETQESHEEYAADHISQFLNVSI